MEKLSIVDFENDFQKLLNIKNNICDLDSDLSVLINFKNFIYLEDNDNVFHAYKYKDFPNDEIKTIIKNFFLTKKNELLEFYKDSISEFKEKYKDIGLDISDKLKELKLDDEQNQFHIADNEEYVNEEEQKIEKINRRKILLME